MPQHVYKDSSSKPWVERNEKYNFTCEVYKVKPAGTIRLMINGTIIGPGINTTIIEHPEHDNTYILTKTVQHHFKYLQHVINSSCQVGFRHGNWNMTTKETKMMLIYCKFIYIGVATFVIQSY